MFGSLDFSRRDLMAVNIQRGRDHGIPDYNTVREAYNLKRITRFYDINPEEYDANPTMKEVSDHCMDMFKSLLPTLRVEYAAMPETIPNYGRMSCNG